MSDEWDEIEDESANVAQGRSPYGITPADEFDPADFRYKNRIQFAEGEYFLVRRHYESAVSQRYLAMWVDAGRYQLDRALTFEVFNASVGNLHVHAAGAAIARFVDRFRGSTAPPPMNSSGHYSLVQGRERAYNRALHNEAAVGGSYEIFIGQMIRDYEESARMLVEGTIAPQVAGLTQLLYSQKAEPGNSGVGRAVERIEEIIELRRRNVLAAMSQVDGILIPLLDRIHQAARKVDALRDAKSEVGRPFRSDSFENRYLQQLAEVTAPDRSGTLLQQTAGNSGGERKRLKLIVGGVAAALAYDRGLARHKVQTDGQATRSFAEFMSNLKDKVPVN